MNIHEYQAKQLLSQYDIPIQKGGVAASVREALSVAQKIGGDTWVVKAQIHAGGRGKGGGVKLVKGLSELEERAGQILGMNLVTPQTHAEGQIVHKVYIEQGCDIASELYFALLINRERRCFVAMVSREGGVDIEEVSAKTPEAIVRVDINPLVGMQAFQARQLAFGLGLEGETLKQGIKLFMKAYQSFIQTDAQLLEVNPLVITGDGNLLPLDAKMTFDDNALFRNKDIEALRDEKEEDPAELEARKHDLSYVKLDGNIGCMVNGAGLAMATMDVIKLYGGEPANFLDVGGGATRERVTEAFKLILSDPNVRGILVNIFGGIMRCDIIAEGIIAAAKGVNIRVPLVVRLAGTNVQTGKTLLAQSGLNIVSADQLGEAASHVVQAVEKAA